MASLSLHPALVSHDTSLLRTYSGLELCFEAPTVAMIDWQDVAVGLSRAPRFAGQTRHFFSVAQHSMLTARLLPEGSGPLMQLVALLHDAAEAYMQDIPTPLKRLLPEYKAIEDRLLRVIYQAAGIPDNVALKPPVVEAADKRAARLEASRLQGSHAEVNALVSSAGAESQLVPMSSSTAQSYYLTTLRNVLSRVDGDR